MSKRSTWYVILKTLAFLAVYTVFHFAYQILPWPVFAVSESVWEHLKIGFFAAAFLALGETIGLLAKKEVFSGVRLLFSRITGVVIIPPFLFLLFYLMVALLGKIKLSWLAITSAVIITFLSGLTAAFLENEMLDFRWENKPVYCAPSDYFHIAAFLSSNSPNNPPYYPLFVER